MPTSVVIPAHDEETVIARCLEALVAGASPGELDVVVVCNACRDRTADVARAFGGCVRVVETPVASKTHALNAGDDAVRGFPRLYVDADVVLPLEGVRAITRRLAETGAAAASPTMDLDARASSWPVRAFYAVWTRMPYVREGMIGVGVYALSAEGRSRFGRFPDVIADDGYVRALFRSSERIRVAEAKVRVVAPSRLRDLVRVRSRSRMGRYELAQRFPEIVGNERTDKRYGSALGVVVLRPWLWPHAAMYLYVNLLSRLRARDNLKSRETYVWERDASSRQPGPAPAARVAERVPETHR